MKVMKLIVCSLLIGIISAKPVDNDSDYRQYSGSNSYSSPSLSGGYSISQGTYPVGYAISQPVQPISSYSFGYPGYGGGLAIPGYSGFPNLFG